MKTKILTVFLLGILVVPHISSALTTEEVIENLKSQLTSLLSQIKSLQLQITQLTTNQQATKVDAVCGSAHNQFFSYKPTTNLCNIGRATTVGEKKQIDGTILYTWVCLGENWGKNSICQAYDSNPEKTFVVTSPQINEKLIRGKTYTISWINNDSQVENYNLYLIGGNLITSKYLGIVAGTEQKFEWTVPLDIALASNYQIQIMDSNLKTLVGNSEPFEIISESTAICFDSDGGKSFYVKGATYGTLTTQGSTTKIWEDYCFTEILLKEYYCKPFSSDTLAVESLSYSCPNGCGEGACFSTEAFSQSILSPNGGETWNVGEAYEIKWEKSNFSTENVSINLVNKNSQSIYNLGSLPNNGNYEWTIPSGIVPLGTTDTFKIKISINTQGFPVQDLSDNFFTLIGSMVDGVCGSTNLTHVDTTPTSNLCNSGTPTNMTYSNLGLSHYQWWCKGIGKNHKDSFCLAYKKN